MTSRVEMQSHVLNADELYRLPVLELNEGDRDLHDATLEAQRAYADPKAR
jgi:hypothetical protein